MKARSQFRKYLNSGISKLQTRAFTTFTGLPFIVLAGLLTFSVARADVGSCQKFFGSSSVPQISQETVKSFISKLQETIQLLERLAKQRPLPSTEATEMLYLRILEEFNDTSLQNDKASEAFRAQFRPIDLSKIPESEGYLEKKAAELSERLRKYARVLGTKDGATVVMLPLTYLRLDTESLIYADVYIVTDLNLQTKFAATSQGSGFLEFNLSDAVDLAHSKAEHLDAQIRKANGFSKYYGKGEGALIEASGNNKFVYVMHSETFYRDHFIEKPSAIWSSSLFHP